jgi:hypothetical protein
VRRVQKIENLNSNLMLLNEEKGSLVLANKGHRFYPDGYLFLSAVNNGIKVPAALQSTGEHKVANQTSEIYTFSRNTSEHLP